MSELLFKKISDVLDRLALDNECVIDRFEAQTDFIDDDVTVTFRMRVKDLAINGGTTE